MCNFGLALLIVCISGCAAHAGLDDLLVQDKLRKEIVQAGQFELLTLSSMSTAAVDSLHIYIGGDGLPWVDNRPAVDPTGKNLIALSLMAKDPVPAVYLSRPCYNLGEMPASCTPDLWTSGRYSELVIVTMTAAVDRIITARGAGEVTLIGYSGGGVIALLVAQRLSKQPVVITVATNLDIDSWTEFHKLLPLSTSINPLDSIPADAQFRQIHLIGREDRVVPTATISRYMETHTKASFYHYKGFDHSCCWVENWRDILASFKLAR